MCRNLKKILVLGGLCLQGCVTSEFIENVNVALTDIQKAVGESLPGGISEISLNQREYTSSYFVLRAQKNLKGTKVRTENYEADDLEREKPQFRYQAVVLILGDRRPYRIEVSVNKEKRGSNGSSYNADGKSEPLAQRLAGAISEYLAKRTKSKNIIDDFRAF